MYVTSIKRQQIMHLWHLQLMMLSMIFANIFDLAIASAP